MCKFIEKIKDAWKKVKAFFKKMKDSIVENWDVIKVFTYDVFTLICALAATEAHLCFIGAVFITVITICWHITKVTRGDYKKEK